MSRAIIYLIINKQTGHKYIGNTTIAMNKEWVNHLERSKRMSSEPIHKAFREYGTHNFMIKELDSCDENELINKTNYWIEKYAPEYNPITIQKEQEIETPIIKPIEVKEKKKREKPDYLLPWNEKTRGNGKHCGLRIRCKNLETGLCSEYESARVAAIEITGNAKNNANILLAARTGRTAYNHKWQLLEEKKKRKSVFGVNKKTEQIELRYDSMASAVKAFGYHGHCAGMVKSLKHPGRYSWKGYYWFYG